MPDLLRSSSCWRQTPFTFISRPSPPPPPSPPQLAPFRGEVTVGERWPLFQDELRLLLLLFVSPSLFLSLLPPSSSSETHGCVFSSFSFSQRVFSFLGVVGVTPVNGTMQPSVKLKLLVSLELLKRGFYTCMHSSPSHTL